MQNSSRAPITSSCIPLSMAQENETVTVQRISSDTETRQHLSDMGIVEGSDVVVESRAGGDVIVSSKGARFALGKSLTRKIWVAWSTH